MPMLQYAEVDEKAWRPLEIQERLDAYYSFREARHEELKPLPKKADPFAHRELSFIPAESLGTLPETAHMTIAARRAFFNPKSREEIIADLEKRRLEAEARQAAREEAERLALREAEAAAEAEAARLEAEQDAADEAAGKKKKKKRKKKKKAAGGSRPASAAVERPKVAAAKRPLSAPAKIARALPIRTYATEFRGAVRGLPDAPTCDVKAAPGSRTGHRSAILSDKEVYAVKEPSVEDGPVDPDPTPRNADGTPREHRTVEFTGTLLMRLTSATPWANVRYTLDGSAVKRTSRIYRRPLELSNHCVVRCVTSKRGWSSGELIVRFVRMADKRGIKEKMLNAAKRGAALGLVDQRRISRGDAPDAVEDMDDTQLLLRAVLAQDVPSVREIVSGGAASPEMIRAVSPDRVKQELVTDCSFVASLCIAAAFEQRFRRQLQHAPAALPQRCQRRRWHRLHPLSRKVRPSAVSSEGSLGSGQRRSRQSCRQERRVIGPSVPPRGAVVSAQPRC